MNVLKLISFGGFSGLVALMAMSACTNEKQSADENVTAAVGMALTGVDYSNNSVRIIGDRDVDADSKYGCQSHVNTCFNFDAAGHPIDPVTGDNGFSDLCPFDNFPNGNWTFTYAVYSEPDCMGTQINDGTHNFTCYDIDDLFTRENPNESADEVLDPGLNENVIICITKPASKTFDFNTCEDISDPAAPATLVLDCGCGGIGPAACTCPQFDDTTPDLPAGCVFNPDCQVVCG